MIRRDITTEDWSVSKMMNMAWKQARGLDLEFLDVMLWLALKHHFDSYVGFKYFFLMTLRLELYVILALFFRNKTYIVYMENTLKFSTPNSM
jgi:hypothetical protein